MNYKKKKGPAGIDLVVAQLHRLLLQVAEVPHREGVEQGDAGDGGHGRHRQVVLHRVRHDALHEPFRRALRRHRGGAGGTRRRWQVLRYRRHGAATVRARLAVRVREVVAAVAVAATLGASVEGLCWLHRRRLRQAEEGAVGGRCRRKHRRAEERVLGGAGLHVGGVELVDAGVEVADAADHGVLADELDGGGDGQREEGEEEVDDFLARLGEQHPLRLPVDEELHAQRGGGGCGGCHLDLVVGVASFVEVVGYYWCYKRVEEHGIASLHWYLKREKASILTSSSTSTRGPTVCSESLAAKLLEHRVRGTGTWYVIRHSHKLWNVGGI